MAINWDAPDWGGHVTESEWGSWLPERVGKSEEA